MFTTQLSVTSRMKYELYTQFSQHSVTWPLGYSIAQLQEPPVTLSSTYMVAALCLQVAFPLPASPHALSLLSALRTCQASILGPSYQLLSVWSITHPSFAQVTLCHFIFPLGCHVLRETFLSARPELLTQPFWIPSSYFNATIWYFSPLFICLLPPVERRLQAPWPPHSLLTPKCLEQCLAHRRHSNTN